MYSLRSESSLDKQTILFFVSVDGSPEELLTTLSVSEYADYPSMLEKAKRELAEFDRIRPEALAAAAVREVQEHENVAKVDAWVLASALVSVSVQQEEVVAIQEQIAEEEQAAALAEAQAAAAAQQAADAIAAQSDDSWR